MPIPALPNDCWSLDFVSDQFVCDRRFRILAVFDVCTRECLAAIADTSTSGRRVARELDLPIVWRGNPSYTVMFLNVPVTTNSASCAVARAKSHRRNICVPINPLTMAKVAILPSLLTN